MPHLQALLGLASGSGSRSKEGSGRGSCREPASPGVGVGRPLPTGGGGALPQKRSLVEEGAGSPFPRVVPLIPSPTPRTPAHAASALLSAADPLRGWGFLLHCSSALHRRRVRLGLGAALPCGWREPGSPSGRLLPHVCGTEAGNSDSPALLFLNRSVQQHQEQPADITVVFGVPQSPEQSGSRLPVSGWLGGCGLLCVSTAQARHRLSPRALLLTIESFTSSNLSNRPGQPVPETPEPTQRTHP